MKEDVFGHTDLMNLTRWATLFIVLFLVATPHLRQQEREAQAVAFESSSAGSDQRRREIVTGAPSQDQQGNESKDCGQAFKEIGIDPEVENLSSTGVPGPMAPIKDEWSLPPLNLTPQPTGLHGASLSCEEPEAGNSESKSPSVDKGKQGTSYDGIIERVAKRYQVDPALVKAIIMAESSYNPRAVSRKGARGLMQLMPSTARALGVEDSFDPEDNIDAGVRYFKQLLKQFDGDLKLAIAAYNAGSRKVRMYKGIPPFKHTRYYVARVIEYHQRYQQ